MEGINPYIYKLSKQINLNELISEDSFDFISIFLAGILREISRLYQINFSLQETIKKILTEQICKYSLSEGNKSIEKFKLSLPTNGEMNLAGKDYNYEIFNSRENSTRSSCSGLKLETLIIENYL